MLFKHFADVDAVRVPRTGTVDEIVDAVARMAPTYGGINLEDISAPRCFEIERRLKERLDIPVFHDDQHGTAIVALAALYNAAQVVDKRLEDLTVVVSGAGAAVSPCRPSSSGRRRRRHRRGLRGIIGPDRVGLPDHKESLRAITNWTGAPACSAMRSRVRTSTSACRAGRCRSVT